MLRGCDLQALLFVHGGVGWLGSHCFDARSLWGYLNLIEVFSCNNRWGSHIRWAEALDAWLEDIDLRNSLTIFDLKRLRLAPLSCCHSRAHGLMISHLLFGCHLSIFIKFEISLSIVIT